MDDKRDPTSAIVKRTSTDLSSPTRRDMAVFGKEETLRIASVRGELLDNSRFRLVRAATFGGFAAASVSFALVSQPLFSGLFSGAFLLMLSWFASRAIGARVAEKAAIKGFDRVASKNAGVLASGRVLEGDTFVAEVSGERVVMARYFGIDEGDVSNGLKNPFGKREELHAVDFAIQDSEGQCIEVEAANSYLLVDPRRVRSRKWHQDPLKTLIVTTPLGNKECQIDHEETLKPGDDIEIIAEEVSTLDGAANGNVYRQSARGRKILGTKESPILIRKIQRRRRALALEKGGTGR